MTTERVGGDCWLDERQTQTANTLTQTRMRLGNTDSNARKRRRFQSLEQY